MIILYLCGYVHNCFFLNKVFGLYRNKCNPIKNRTNNSQLEKKCFIFWKYKYIALQVSFKHHLARNQFITTYLYTSSNAKTPHLLK